MDKKKKVVSLSEQLKIQQMYNQQLLGVMTDAEVVEEELKVVKARVKQLSKPKLPKEEA
jgi:hypothetical protein